MSPVPSLVESPYFFRGVILPSGSIRTAREIPHPTELSHDTLINLTALGYDICTKNPSIMVVAFSQIDPSQFALFGLDPEVYSNVIYYPAGYSSIVPSINLSWGRSFRLEGGILINTKLKVDDPKHFLNTEACASITAAVQNRVRMFVARPERAQVQAYVWHEKFDSGPRVLNQTLTHKQAGFLQHEFDHVLGNDASTYPDRLFDPWNEGKSFEQLHQIPHQQIVEAVMYTRRNSDFQFLVNRNGNILLVNGNNQIIRPFR